MSNLQMYVGISRLGISPNVGDKISVFLQILRFLQIYKLYVFQF